MRSIIALLFAIIWVAVPALAQDKAWLGAETRDLTKAQADALGWDEPRGAWGVSVAKDGPAAKAGVLVGDVIVLDGQEIKGRAGLEAAVEAKAVGAAPRLRYWRNKREKRPVTVALVAAPKPVEVAQIPNALQLMLDSGGHMSLITGLAWTPDGKQIISSGNDKVIRVWDAETGRTVRTVRGEIGPSFEGQIFAMALSPDGRWLAVGGWLHTR